ncbi:hypothetical protein TNIN_267031 [Trichonephila inaurata madagascariensis]|uniref:Uncharacterized protein n=1 Tax=Trichonephila inaurata madagascariensis TaxID=2747483 RepID=A0A8X6XST3_9ARAC|nr:hypothetical protein TNIN_267031 [Trichonephila inaurata madagascariensis]
MYLLIPPTHAYYRNNFSAFTPTWYTATDMQFHLMTPLFMVSLFRWPRFGYGLITLGICTSCCYRCILTIKYSLFQYLSCIRYYVDGDLDWLMHR